MDEELELIDKEESELDRLRKETLPLTNEEKDKSIKKKEEPTHDILKEKNVIKKEEPSPKNKKERVKKKKLYRVLSVKLLILSGLLVPLFGYLYIISLHSNRLINGTLSIVMLILTIASCMLFIGSLVTYFVKRKEKAKRFKLSFKIIMSIFFTGYVGLSTLVMVLLYGPASEFRDWLVTTAMMTMNHRYLAEWFYDSDTINEILANNTVVESGEDTNPDLIEIGGGIDTDKTVYANEYEEAVLKKDEGNELYKIIDINEKKFKGKMAVIYDPAKVTLATSRGTGSSLNNSYGQYITTMSKENNAVIAINAGGFYDPDWNSSGGVPHGVVISKGKLIANNRRAVSVGGIIGFNKENKLVLARMSAKEALAAGIRDAVDFGPFLIVNGKSSFINGNGGWGKSPRTAIAQRKDGIVLFLVIDGRSTASAGADMNNLVDVLLKYGAYNAANLDGGTSSAMALNGKIITNPRNGNFQAKTRAVPNAWIVKK